MRGRSIHVRYSALTVLALAIALAGSFELGLSPRVVAQHVPELAVIAHPRAAVGSLEHAELQSVFLRRRLTWDDGTRILPFNYVAGDALRTGFDRTVLGWSPDQAARYWIDARIRSGTEAPRTLSSPSLVVRVVMQLQGSIGYVPASSVPQGVRIVARVREGRVTAP